MSNQALIRITRASVAGPFLPREVAKLVLAVGDWSDSEGLQPVYVCLGPSIFNGIQLIGCLDEALAVACKDVDVRNVKALVIGPPETPYEFGFFEVRNLGTLRFISLMGTLSSSTSNFPKVPQARTVRRTRRL